MTKSKGIYTGHLPVADRLDHYAPMGSPDECWDWTGSRDQFGYGRLRISGKIVRAHRLAYELAYGPIPGGLHVLHACDNPACVNPRHLSAGTHTTNQRESWQRDRKRRVRKLNPKDVLAIRASQEPYPILAAQFGVSKSQIERVKNGKRGHGILLMLKEVA